MADMAYESMKDGLARVKAVNADEEAQRMAFVREKAMHEGACLIKDAVSRGRAEGIEIGKKEGYRNLLTDQLGFKFGTLSDDMADQLQQATAEQLKQWGKNLLSANSPEAVFSTRSEG